MDMLDRLNRITSLFAEGEALTLGLDDDGTPVMIWVNKPNSFETEESRRDAMAARADRIQELKEPDNPDLLNVLDQMERWTTEELITYRVGQATDAAWLEAVNDIDADPDWRERLDYMRRMPAILTDSGTPSDDPRFVRVNDLVKEYEDAIAAKLKESQEAKRRELASTDVKVLRDDFLEDWRNKISVDAYMQEKRHTELWYSLRDCAATRDTQAKKWDHSNCDHSVRLCPNRADVRTLPEGVLQQSIEVLDRIQMGQRAAGNWVAPPSSYESSELPNEEAESTASTPAETQPEPAMT